MNLQKVLKILDAVFLPYFCSVELIFFFPSVHLNLKIDLTLKSGSLVILPGDMFDVLADALDVPKSAEHACNLLFRSYRQHPRGREMLKGALEHPNPSVRLLVRRQ